MNEGSSGAQKQGGFFSSTNKRSEINEWRVGLGNEKESVRRDTVKKVIAAMTVGKDVSMLFTDVIKCVATNNIELKKLVYLYIMNYAKTQPDLAIMAVNQFERDSNHPNPLIRGLAVRTMGCIRVNKIVEYLAEPIRKTIKDKDPYVRKTAAVAIAKLFDINAELAIEQGFVEALEELLTDENPMVVANAVKALDEISSLSDEIVLDFTEKTVKTLLTALNQCTEWGQVFILDALSNYSPKSEKEAQEISDRVAPRLQHANSAVVLSAIRVINKMIDIISNENEKAELVKKMSAPLVTLLSGHPEVQYVALRNIDLIVQSRPGILTKDIKMFFCKYNDPIYVKLEKLDIMVKLASERNIDTVLMEFKEYASEVDVEFVRRSVRAIGRCAIKLERAAQRCVDVLLDLIQTKVNYVVQEAIIVIKDIFRRYPNRYEAIIGKLCENLDTLDEPEAKAAMIWIIGEYSNKIENADELLAIFIDTFHDETSQVQLSLLTAVMKLFLRRPGDTRELIKKVLTLSTEESDDPDLRDRGYIYWRLLNEDPESAKAVVLSEKPVIRDDSTNIPKNLLNELVKYIGSLASVYHKPPELFVPGYKKKKSATGGGEDQEVEDYLREQQNQAIQDRAPNQDLLGLDDILGTGASPSMQPTTQNDDLYLDDVMGGGATQTQLTFSNTASATVTKMTRPLTEKKLLLSADKGKGLVVYGAFNRNANGQIEMAVTFENQTTQPITGYACKFNKNTFGFVPGQVQASPCYPGQKVEGIIPVLPGQNESDNVSPLIQVALKCDLGVVYFQDSIPFSVLLLENGLLDTESFLTIFQSIPEETESSYDITRLASNNPNAIISKLQAHNIFFVADHQGVNYYFSAKFNYGTEEVIVVAELVLQQGATQCKLNTRSAETQFIQFFEKDVERILNLTF
ncbi:hypothetical protein ABK040_002994 [Willaertia magna]